MKRKFSIFPIWFWIWFIARIAWRSDFLCLCGSACTMGTRRTRIHSVAFYWMLNELDWTKGNERVTCRTVWVCVKVSLELILRRQCEHRPLLYRTKDPRSSTHHAHTHRAYRRPVSQRIINGRRIRLHNMILIFSPLGRNIHRALRFESATRAIHLAHKRKFLQFKMLNETGGEPTRVPYAQAIDPLLILRLRRMRETNKRTAQRISIRHEWNVLINFGCDACGGGGRQCTWLASNLIAYTILLWAVHC